MEPTEEGAKELERLETYFLDHQRPLKFNPYEADNVVLERELSFEEVCAIMEENGVAQPKKLTEWEFYSRLVYYQNRYQHDHADQRQ